MKIVKLHGVHFHLVKKEIQTAFFSFSDEFKLLQIILFFHFFEKNIFFQKVEITLREKHFKWHLKTLMSSVPVSFHALAPLLLRVAIKKNKKNT